MGKVNKERESTQIKNASRMPFGPAPTSRLRLSLIASLFTRAWLRLSRSAGGSRGEEIEWILVRVLFVGLYLPVWMLLEKNADLTDLAFGEIGRNSAPQEKPSGTLTAQIFFLLPQKICTLQSNNPILLTALGGGGGEGRAKRDVSLEPRPKDWRRPLGRREGKSLSPPMVYAQPEEGALRPRSGAHSSN